MANKLFILMVVIISSFTSTLSFPQSEIGASLMDNLNDNEQQEDLSTRLEEAEIGASLMDNLNDNEQQEDLSTRLEEAAANNDLNNGSVILNLKTGKAVLDVTTTETGSLISSSLEATDIPTDKFISQSSSALPPRTKSVLLNATFNEFSTFQQFVNTTESDASLKLTACKDLLKYLRGLEGYYGGSEGSYQVQLEECIRKAVVV